MKRGQKLSLAALPIAGWALWTVVATESASAQGELIAACSKRIEDQATGSCLEASTDPTIGLLYPMSQALNVSANEFVGIGTSVPNTTLHVSGDGAGGDDLLRVQRNGSTRLFLDSDGQMGVGAFFDPNHAFEVRGQVLSFDSSSSLARAIEAQASDDGVASSNFGVISFVQSENGTALRGRAMSTTATGDATAVHGDTMATNGIGVLGEHRSANGTAAGVEGYTDSNDSFANGVLGVVEPTGAGAVSAGVRGMNMGTGGLGVGVYGTQAGSGWGVAGSVDDSGIGVRGFAPSSAGGIALYGQGDCNVTGAKCFVQPHPTDPSQELVFVALEGNESGTYCRGEGSIRGGTAVIEVPEDFRFASEAQGLTIQTTAVGGPAQIWIESIDLDRVVVRADADVDFHYFLNGVRRGFTEHRTVRANRAFRPSQDGRGVGAGLPAKARQILVENGTLNPDFSLNLATATQLGWEVFAPAQPFASRHEDEPMPSEISPERPE